MASTGHGTAEAIFEHELDVIEDIALRQLTIAKQRGLHGLRISWFWQGNNDVAESSSLRNSHLGIFAAHRRRESSLQEIPEAECVSDVASETDSDLLGVWSRDFVSAPHRVKPSFPGHPTMLFALFKSGCKAPNTVSITAGGKEEQKWNVKIESQEHVFGTKIHAMAARALVEDLEEGTSALHDSSVDQQTIDVELVDISCR